MQASSRTTPAPLPLSARFAAAIWSLSRRHWRFVVVAMLALLHVVVMRGTVDEWARMLLLAHLGLLLLWQPFVRGEHPVSAAQGLFIALGAAAVMLWLDWWLLAFWVVVLSGLVGGKVFLHQARWQRRGYLVVLVYLLALLAVLILPQIAPRPEVTREVRGIAKYGLPLLLLALALIPAEPEAPETAQVIDFFYSIFLMLVLGMVILGSFTFMTLGRMPYLVALSDTVFLIGGSIFVLGLERDVQRERAEALANVDGQGHAHSLRGTPSVSAPFASRAGDPGATVDGPTRAPTAGRQEAAHDDPRRRRGPPAPYRRGGVRRLHRARRRRVIRGDLNNGSLQIH